MAWAVAIPAAVSLFETMLSKSGDDKTAAAGADKIRAMQAGATQLAGYRPQVEQQMLSAMNNRVNAYNPAQNVLAQMYGGHPGHFAKIPLTPSTIASDAISHVGPIFPPRVGRGESGPAINPGTPGGARAGNDPSVWMPPVPGGARAGNDPSAYLGPQTKPNIGFGGEMPPNLLRRKIL